LATVIDGNRQEVIQKIDQLRKKKNAVILAHYYQRGEIQDIADVVGYLILIKKFFIQTLKADVPWQIWQLLRGF